MADTKSPSAFAPGQTSGTAPAAAVAPYADAPAGDNAIHAASTPQNILSSPAAGYTDTKGVGPPPHDAQQIVGQDPEKAAAQAQRASNGEWTHGFWDCFAPADLCFKSCCCPCFVYGKTQARLEDPSLRTYESINAPCGIFCLLSYAAGAGWVMAWLKRTEMRTAYNIQGSSGMDFLAACCCPCCALMQMDKEVVTRQSQAGAVPGAAPQGYAAPGGMAAVPQ